MALDSKWSLFMLLPGVFCSVSNPVDIVKTESIDKEAIFVWNTTGITIIEAKWGLFDGSTVVPFFIKVPQNGRPELSPDLDNVVARYKHRVNFIGNISLGRAWFVLSNLTTNDTKVYALRIVDSNGNVDVDQVKLTVLPPPTPTARPTTATITGGPKKIFSGSFKTNRTYVKEMADKNSQPYRNEADIIKIMFRDDVFKGKLASVNDITLISGSVIVIFNITLVNVSDPLAVFKAAVANSGGTLSGMTIDPNSIKEGQYIPPSKTTAATPTTPSGEEDGLGAGEIAGIVIAVVLVVVVIIVLAVWFWKKSKNNHGDIGACNDKTEMDNKPAGNGSSPEA